MRKASAVVAPALVVLCRYGARGADGWPHWLGPHGNGVSDAKKIPTKWDEKTNVLWKTDLEGLGNSSPVVWGDKVFLTGWTPAGDRRKPKETFALCLHRVTGNQLWKTKLPILRTPRGRKPHRDNGWATPTAATDGKRVVVAFGTGTIACLDFDGKLLWTKDLGPIRHRHGVAASPVTDGERAYYLLDQLTTGPESFVIAFDLKTGREVWRKRPEPPGGPGPGYSTPILRDRRGGRELVAWFGGAVRAYDPRTGARLWKEKALPLPVDDLIRQPVTTPVAAGEMIYLGQSDLAKAIRVPTGGSGPGTVWSIDKASGAKVSRSCGLLVHEGLVYAASDRNTITCYSAKTGKEEWSTRVSGKFYSQPVAAGGYVIFTSRKGKSYVFKAGPRPELVSTNALPGSCISTPAIADEKLYIRTMRPGGTTLWCIGNK